MSSITGSQNLLVNVFRPVYTYDAGTFSSSLQLSNIGTDFTAAIGDSAENVYVGLNAGNSSLNLRACVSNTALGYNAAGLISNVSNSTFVGANAGAGTLNASNVISIGYNAGGSGSNNIYLGNSTKSTGDNNILIGHGIDAVASSNLLRIGTNIYGNLSNGWVGIGTSTQTSGNTFDVQGDANISGTLTAGALSIPAFAPANLVVPGYLRNAVTPTQFDISGGNISNSATTRSSNFIGTSSASNSIGGVTLSNTNLTLAGTITGSTSNTSNSIGGVTLSNNNISNSGSITTNTVFTTNLYAPSTADPSAIAYINMGTGINGGSGSSSSNMQFLWLRRGGGPEKYAGINFGAYQGNSYMMYNNVGGSLVIKYMDTLPSSKAQLDACNSILTLTSAGNVGMGTSAPTTALDVSSSSAVTVALRNNSGQSSIRIAGNGFADVSGIQLYHNSNDQGIFNFNVLPFYIWTNNTRRMTILSNGNVGIGTLTPGSILDISGGDPAMIVRNRAAGGTAAIRVVGGPFDDLSGIRLFQSSTAQGLFSSNQLPMTFTTQNTTRILIDTCGNVGIGTTSNTSKLDVDGGIQIFGQSSSNNPIRPALTTGSTVPAYEIRAKGNSGGTGNQGFMRLRAGGYSSTGASTYIDLAGSNADDDLSDRNIVFGVRGQERMRINVNGSVGIGTDDPSYRLDVSGTGQFSNIITPGYIRNDLTPSQFDISGGIISNSGALITSNIRTGAPGLTTVTAIQEFGRGYDNVGTVAVGSTPAIAFQFNGGGFRHFIRSRHNDGIADWGNGIDFFTNTGGQTASTAPGTGNVLAMAVTSGGIGIGTRTPSTSLDVSSTNNSAGSVRIVNNSSISNTRVIDALMPNIPNTTGRVQILMGKNIANSNNYATIAYRHLGGDNSTSNYLGIGTPTGDGLVVNQSGNVGIGTVAPQYSLDICGSIIAIQTRHASSTSGIRATGSGFSDASGIQLYHNNGEQGIYSFNTQPMHLYTNNVRRLTILSNGNVGIGITGPTEALQVAGNIRMGNSTYNNLSLSGGNSLGYLYGAFNNLSDGIHLGYNYLRNHDASSNVIVNPGLGTSRITAGVDGTTGGYIGMFTGTVNTVPTNLGYYQNRVGNVGIGITNPIYKLDVSGVTRLETLSSNSATTNNVIVQNDFLTSQNLTGSDYIAGNILLAGGTAAGVGEWFGVRVGAVIPSNQFQDRIRMGLFTPRTTNDNTSVERVSILSGVDGGRVGVGTTAPEYALDVSAGVSNASVNMSSWPRAPAGNTLVVRGYQTTLAGNTVNWGTVVNSISTNLMTWDNSNVAGSSFIVRRSGIWSISYYLSVSPVSGYSWIDASTNNNSNVLFNTAGNPTIAFGQTGGNNAPVNFTGYLASNASVFYKPRVFSGLASVAVPVYLNISFLYETPTIAGNHPFA